MARKTYEEGGIRYENIDGQIYKNGRLIPQQNYKYIPSAIGGTRVDPMPKTPAATAPQATPALSPAAPTPAPTAQATTPPTGYVPVRNWGESRGYKVDWTGTAPTIGGMALDPGTFVNIGGRTYADPRYLGQFGADVERTDILRQLRERAANPPRYRPERDPAYQAASEAISRQVMEQLNARGILNSTITRDDVAQAMANILPQFQQQFYSQQQGQTGNLLDLLSAYGGIEEQQYQRQLAAEENRIAQEQAAIQAQEKEINRAWERVKNIGYVDNIAALTLGLEPGTPSFEAQKTYDDMQTRLRLAKENNAAALQRTRESNAAAMARTMFRTPLEQAKDEAAMAFMEGRATPEQKEILGIKTNNRIDPKESLDNYYEAIKNIQSKEGITTEEAFEYAKTISPYMDDANYRDLLKWIDTNVYTTDSNSPE